MADEDSDDMCDAYVPLGELDLTILLMFVCYLSLFLLFVFIIVYIYCVYGKLV
mgnify:CR=1 FL=1